MIGFLTRAPVIAGSFALTVVFFYAFSLWTPSVGGTILDTVGPVDEVKALLAGMSDEQKSSHLWMTLLLDIVFPFIYGAFFIGAIHRGFPGTGKWLALFAYAAMATDLSENTIQLMALSGNEGLLGAKSLLTPTKTLTFGIAALISLVGVIVALNRGMRG